MEDQVINEIAVFVSGSTIDYTEQLTDISSQISTLNGLLCSTIFFLGILAGLLFMMIFWQRFNR